MAVIRYTVENRKILNELTKALRREGYNIITFCSDFRELEKGDQIAIIEIGSEN